MSEAVAEGRRVRSMTGFARISGRVSDQLGFTLGIKSVNHRFLDPHLRLPSGYDALEMEIRKALKQSISRGHVEVFLQIDRSVKSGLRLDAAVARAYVDAFREAAEQFEVKSPGLDLTAVLRMPGVMTGDTSDRTDDVEAVTTAVSGVFPQALAELNVMREREGEALKLELVRCMQRIREVADEVRDLRKGAQQAHFAVLKQKLIELTNEAGISEERVMTEAALLAERGDVDEELVRLHAHVDHFVALLDEGSEVGKKLDFLLQEFNRESNTLLSKTSGVVTAGGLRITELGLLLKAEIERAREQVQNLE